ncbi:MAG TPA: hypothetical protein P5123_01070 [Spirochaetota bacterium]|nr:hypothetical protein [Spirochaetota bacterium]
MKKALPLLLLICFSCSKTPEEKFQEAVLKYNESKDPEARLVIEENYFNSLGAVQIDKADNYIAGHNCIILEKESLTTIITSDGFKEPWSEDILHASYNPETKVLCTSDGYKAEFFVFGRNEETQEQTVKRVNTIELTKDEEKPIDAFYVEKDSLYYFYNNRIFTADISSGEANNLLPDTTFSAPFKKDQFRVSLKIRSDHLAVCIGNAGSYNLSLYSLTTNKKVFQNKKTTSIFFALLNDRILYIGGKTGAWVIYRHFFTYDKPEQVILFKTLRDISISGETIFYVDADDFHITDTFFTKQLSEKGLYSIKRLINDYLLIAHNGTLYLVQTKKYFDTNKHFEELVPDFFEVEEISAEDISDNG